MGTPTVTAAALGSALAYGAGGVLQHRAARHAPAGRGLQLKLLAHLTTRPLWLVGLAAVIIAFGLHALALAGGELAIVQPLLVSGLLFALPASVVHGALSSASPRTICGMSVQYARVGPNGGSVSRPRVRVSPGPLRNRS